MTTCTSRDLLFRKRAPRAGTARGFTLIELMIVVAIVAILAGLGYPSYLEYVRKSRRADAQSFMSEVVARQQHWLVDRRAYATSITAAPADEGLGMTVPANVSSHYTLTLTTDNATNPPSFTLSAVPAGSQAGEKCGTLGIDQRGVKTASGSGTCW
jgi:type IV pilus assembly protein PilE